MKKLKLLLLVINVLVVMPLNAQSVNHVWSGKVGGTGNDRGQFIALDGSGNTYTTGYFSGVADFDPGIGVYNLTSAGGTDIFLCKLDPAGNFLWAHSFGSTGSDAGVVLSIDLGGNVVLVGSFSGTVDFDPGVATQNLVSGGMNDIFILKLNGGGNFVWANSIGGANNEVVYGMTQDASGNIYATGEFTGENVDFDPTTGNALLTSSGYTSATPGDPDIFILKLTNSGGFGWVKQIGASGYEGTRAITVDAGGNLLLTGYFNGAVDFDPNTSSYNLTASGPSTIFIMKLDGAGNFIWAKQFGSGQGNGIATDGSGNVLATGYFSGVVDFDPGTSVNNLTASGAGYDIFVSKLDAGGNFVWAKSIGNTYGDYGNAIAVDVGNSVYIAGRFTGQVDFDPSSNIFTFVAPSNPFVYNAFILKLDLSGNFVWARNIAKPGLSTPGNWSICSSLALDNAGNIFTTGVFRGSADFDPGINQFLMPSSVEDAFIQKLDQGICGLPSYSTLALTVCDSLVMAGNTYKVSGASSNVFSNAFGCDSIVNLNLTVNYSSGSTQAHTSCNSFTFNGNVYTTSGLHLDTFTNAMGCDSIVSLQLTLLHSTFDTLVHSTCDTFDLNGTSYYATGFYSQAFTAANGCDSVVVLDLTVLNTLDTIPQTSCGSFVFNGSTYTNSGFYQHSFTSVNSCDSIVVLDLTINSVDVTISNTGSSLMAGATGATYQWYDCNGWLPIPGETAQNFVFSQSGSYAVEVTENGCIDTSVCLIVNSINGINKHSEMRLYPNPSDGSLTIEMPSPLSDAVVRVTDLGGRVVQKDVRAKGMKIVLDLTSLSSGLYIVEVEDNNSLRRANFSKL